MLKKPALPQSPSRRLRLLLMPLCACIAGGALADNLPKRKAGLWEINTRMQGMPPMGPVQQCIDRNTDNLMEQEARKEANCSVMDIKTQGNRVSVRSVCKIDKSTATSDATFTGAFDSGYKGEITVRYSPPLEGMAEARMTQEAKWLGPCLPGQKPGDVVMPNMGRFNMNEMMNDPQVREMMKRQK